MTDSKQTVVLRAPEFRARMLELLAEMRDEDLVMCEWPGPDREGPFKLTNPTAKDLCWRSSSTPDGQCLHLSWTSDVEKAELLI